MPLIESVGMDGTGRALLVGDRLVMPTGLTVDAVKDHLYWTDSQASWIERLDLNTGYRCTCLTSCTTHGQI